MMTEDSANNETYMCPECQVGVFRLKHITYFTRMRDELLTVPEFPAWVCDMCGRREFDQRALNWLSVLLDSQRALNASAHRRAQHSAPAEEPPHSTISK